MNKGKRSAKNDFVKPLLTTITCIFLFALFALLLVYLTESNETEKNMPHLVNASVSIFCAETNMTVVFTPSENETPQTCSIIPIKSSSFMNTPIVFFSNISCFGQDYTDKIDGMFDNNTIYIKGMTDPVETKMTLLHEFCHYTNRGLSYHYINGDCSNPIILKGITDEETQCYNSELNLVNFTEVFFTT